MNRAWKIACAGLILAGGGISAISQGAERLRGKVVIDGSSTVGPISEAVAEEFRGEYGDGVRVTVSISGTGGGFKRFVIGETDISDASRPIKAEEYAAARSGGVEFIEIPVAYDGLTIVVNKSNDWAKEITVDDLKKIFLEKHSARTWKDVRSDWPATPIKIYSPGTDSGTFDYFKEVVAGKGDALRGDMSVSEDDNVLVKGVTGDKGAIGFFGCAYFFENEDSLRALPVINGDGEAVDPTPESIEDGSYNPFSRPLFIYVNKKSAQRPEVDAFIRFYLENAADLSEDVGYVRLPASVYAAAKKNYLAGRTGTQFLTASGDKVHGPVTRVYK